MRSHLVSLIVVLCVISACTSDGASPPAASGEVVELTVYGAASLKGVLAQVKVAYEAAVPDTTLTIATDSSAALATQIELGAPADVFLSADTTNPQKLVDAGSADGEMVEFAGNALTIITPTDNPGGLTTAFDLGKAGIRVIAAGDEVPVTRYATQLVDNLANLPGAPADFAAIYAANIVSREDNVAAVRTKIELGEGDAAIVYITDAVAFASGTNIDVPDGANVRATYAGVVVKASTQPEAARAFLEWIAGPAGREILGDAGFLPPA
jgi:molybdate transport system substrate-binding protein